MNENEEELAREIFIRLVAVAKTQDAEDLKHISNIAIDAAEVFIRVVRERAED